MDDLSRRESRFLEQGLAYSLGLAALVACLIIGVGIGISAGNWIFPPKSALVLPSAVNKDSIIMLQAQLSGIQQAAGSIQQLLGVLAAFTGLYSLILGLHTHFSLKQILENAKEDSKNAKERSESAVKNAKNEVEEFCGRIRAQYPHFTDLNMSVSCMLRDTYDVLTAALSKKDGHHSHYWTGFYANISSSQVQQCLFAESQLLVLELFYPDEEKISQMYRVLAYFYSSKYKSEKLSLDWEKSLVYFERSAAASDQSRLRLDKGTHYLLHANVIMSQKGAMIDIHEARGCGDGDIAELGRLNRRNEEAREPHLPVHALL